MFDLLRIFNDVVKYFQLLSEFNRFNNKKSQILLVKQIKPPFYPQIPCHFIGIPCHSELLMEYFNLSVDKPS